MKPDELLYWLSARRAGSWRQFRGAVEELHSADGGEAEEAFGEFPLHLQLQLDFHRLAHVEFFARGCEKGWRVVPPTLAAHPAPGGFRAVLCGARSTGLCERIFRSVDGCEVSHSSGVPEVVRILAADARSLVGAAARIGVGVQLDAPLAILSHLLPCDPPMRGSSQAEFPVGADWAIHGFDEAALAWRVADRRQALSSRTGVFRLVLASQRPRFFLRWTGLTYEMPRAIAIWVLLKRSRRRLIRYDPSTRSLSLPAICRPPQMLERALVLCSGAPPAYEVATAGLTYADVPIEIANFSAALLRQSLQ